MDHSAQRMSKAEWDAWRDQWYAYGSEKLTDDDIAKVVMHVNALNAEIAELQKRGW